MKGNPRAGYVQRWMKVQKMHESNVAASEATPEALIDSATMHFSSKKYHSVVEACALLIKNYSPQDSVESRAIGYNAYMLLAKAHYALAQYTNVLDACAEAAKYLNASELFYYWGLTYIALGQDSDALSKFESAVNLNKANAEYWLQLASAQFKISQSKEQHEKALRSCTSSLDITKTAQAFLLKGQILSNLKKHKEALEACAESVKLDQASFAAHHLLLKSAVALGRCNTTDMAESIRLVDLSQLDSITDKARAELWLQKANLMFGHDNWLAASAATREAMKLCEIVEFRVKCIETLHSISKKDIVVTKDEVISKLQSLLNIDDKCHVAYKMLGQIFYEQQKYRDAVDCAKKAIGCGAKDQGLYRYFVESLLEVSKTSGDNLKLQYLDEALSTCLERQTHTNAFCANIYTQKAWHLLKCGKIDDALKSYQLGVKFNSKDTLCYFASALIMLQQDREGDAIVQSLQKTLPQLAHKNIKGEKLNGALDTVIDVFNKIFTEFSGIPQMNNISKAYLYLSKALVGAGYYAKAVDAIKNLPFTDDVDVASSCYEDAIQIFNALSQQDAYKQDIAKLHRVVGWKYRECAEVAKQNTTKALVFYRKALEKFNDAAKLVAHQKAELYIKDLESVIQNLENHQDTSVHHGYTRSVDSASSAPGISDTLPTPDSERTPQVEPSIPTSVPLSIQVHGEYRYEPNPQIIRTDPFPPVWAVTQPNGCRLYYHIPQSTFNEWCGAVPPSYVNTMLSYSAFVLGNTHECLDY